MGPGPLCFRPPLRRSTAERRRRRRPTGPHRAALQSARARASVTGCFAQQGGRRGHDRRTGRRRWFSSIESLPQASSTSTTCCYSSRAELLRRLGRREEAARSYSRALALAGSDDERRFLERRLEEVTAE